MMSEMVRRDDQRYFKLFFFKSQEIIVLKIRQKENYYRCGGKKRRGKCLKHYKLEAKVMQNDDRLFSQEAMTTFA